MMGTREVYDFKLQKWIPYISDPNIWEQHLLDVRDGYGERDSQGRYMVGSGKKYRELKEMKSLESKMETQRPVFNLVYPVAQATEMGKLRIKRECNKDRKREKDDTYPLHHLKGNINEDRKTKLKDEQLPSRPIKPVY